MVQLLCLTTIPTHPEIAGNRSRVSHLLSNFRKGGAAVSLAYLHDSALQTEYDAEAMNAHWDNRASLMVMDSRKQNPSTDPQLLSQIQMLQEEIRPDIVILTYPFLSSLLDLFPAHCHKLIDTMDIFYRRNTLLIEHAIHVQSQVQDFATKSLEKEALERAHGVIAIQHNDMCYYQELSTLPVHLIEHALLTRAQARTHPPSKKLLFVGSKSYVGLRNVLECINTFLPTIQEKCSNIELVVAGDVQSLIPEELKSKAHFIGRVSDLEALYDSIDIAVSTDVFATGLSIKNITALSHGIPLVTTSIGARGMENGAGSAYLLADTPNTFADHIQHLLADHQLYNQVSTEALSYARSMYKRMTMSIKEIIGAVSMSP